MYTGTTGVKKALKLKKKIPKKSIVSAPKTAEKNKTQYLVRRLKAGSSGIL